jgi:hypothetical protein
MIALLALLSTARADDLPVKAEVSTVTVYLDRARVTRSVTVDVPAGRTDLVFDGLPIALIPASLAAEGEGTAGATLTGIDFRPQRGVEDRDAKVAGLNADVRKATDKIREQQDVIARVQSDLQFVQLLHPVAPPKLEAGLFLADDAASQLAGVSRQVGTDAAALLVEQRTAEKAIRAIQRDIDRMNRDLAQIQSPGNEDSTRVAVGVDAQRAGRVTVRLVYVVTGAGWTPHYDARYHPSDGKVALDLSGEVVQTTGEDWHDVKLVLSTARPQEGTAPPEITPFYLQEGYSYPTTTPTTTATGEGMGYDQAVVADRTTAFEFTSSDTEDVPADGTRRRVFLESLSLSGDVVHQVVPRRVEAAFLTAHVTNTATFTLLAGSVSSYMGTSYVGEGTLNLTPAGEKFDVSFGVDDRVKVEHKRLKQTTADAKAFGNKEHASYAWKTTITNHTGKAIDLRVTDQVPVTRESQWQVETDLVPAIAVPEGTGVFTWEQKLADGKAAEFTTAYVVTWPQGDAPVLME